MSLAFAIRHHAPKTAYFPVVWDRLVAFFRLSTYIFGMAENPFKKTLGQKLAEASEGYAAYRADEATIRANMLRLRAERLAREAANPPEAAPVAEKPKVRKRIIRK